MDRILSGATRMGGPIRLDRVDWIPQALRRQLETYRSQFEAQQFSTPLRDEPWYWELAHALEEECVARDIVAYHFTKEAERGEIAQRGLRILNGPSHRAEFLAKFSDRFTARQRGEIERLWRDFVAGQYQGGREGHLWFCFCCPSRGNPGVKDLLTYFGGEAVYTSLTSDQSLANILQSIGHPVVVHARVNPSTFQQSSYPSFGISALSTWHRTVRADRHPYSGEGFSATDVPASNILAVQDATAWLQEEWNGE